jgi:hypothetical protein
VREKTETNTLPELSTAGVDSVFYQQLNLHYEKLLDLWYEQEKTRLLRVSAEGRGQ